MNLLKIYKRAYYRTLELYDAEERFLKEHPENRIAKNNLKKYREEYEYIHDLIIELENKNFIYNV